MRKRVLSIALTAALLLALMVVAVSAIDYEGHWAEQYIEQARERGWILGDEDGSVRPDDSISRAEFAVMLWRVLGSPAPQEACPFDDVADNAYYHVAATYLYEAGIVTGTGGGMFSPGNTLTREMAFVLLARAFELSPESGETDKYTEFADNADVSPWATDAASILALKGYIEGDGGRLAPQRAPTRGEVAKLLITVYAGENPPVITLTQNPTTSTSGSVKISAEVESKNGIAYIGWRASAKDASYDDKTGFTDITDKAEFSVTKNGWYAVCVVDEADNFVFALIQITNIQVYEDTYVPPPPPPPPPPPQPPVPPSP